MSIEWIGYTVLIVLIVSGIWLFATRPKVYAPMVIRETIKYIRLREPFIVQVIYNSLPKEVKKQIDSKMIALITTWFINGIIIELEDLANFFSSKSAK